MKLYFKLNNSLLKFEVLKTLSFSRSMSGEDISPANSMKVGPT